MSSFYGGYFDSALHLLNQDIDSLPCLVSEPDADGFKLVHSNYNQAYLKLKNIPKYRICRQYQSTLLAGMASIRNDFF